MTVLSKDMLPSGNSVFFSNWYGPEDLPSPDEVRRHHDVLSSLRNIVVRFRHLKLIVKYGRCVREAEGQALWVINRFTDVSAPTVYGWFQDGEEMFIYMSLEEGVTLASRWSDLSKEEKDDIANQMRGMFASISKLQLPPDEVYIGSLNRGPCLDMLFETNGHRRPGPFTSSKTFHDFVVSVGVPFPDSYARQGLPDSLPIKLTHNDLNFDNILVSPQGSRVVAIIDWELAGFYPSYWEWANLTSINEIRGGDIKHFMDTILKPYNLVYRHWSHWFRSTGA